MLKDQSILGPMADRKKTTVWMPRQLLQQVEDEAKRLGVSMNAFFALGGAMLIAEMSRLESPGKKRQQLVREVEASFQKIIEEVKKLT